MSTIRVVLCDVGGVLVELGGVKSLQSMLQQTLSEEEIWHRWLHSPAVRAFETGRLDEAGFARELIREFELNIEPQALIRAFDAWVLGVYPGIADLIARIPPHYTRALLSNSNSLHWPRVIGEMGLGALFERHFVSHLTGRIKPDADAFQHVVDELGCRAEEIFFVDDNLLNVEAARAVGMQATQVRGPDGLERALREAGILP
jgi:HAD superfamily hydrolase (TIGR01509 family)